MNSLKNLRIRVSRKAVTTTRPATPNEKFMEGALSRPESLQEHLIWQLNLQPIPESLRRICEFLIRNLDKNGFHREKPETLVKESELDLLQEALKLVQTFDPLGICVADYKEALMVQALSRPDTPEYTAILINEHFELLERGKIKEIAKKLKIEEKIVQTCLAFIKTLTTFPRKALFQ